jgi:hypothetical protein
LFSIFLNDLEEYFIENNIDGLEKSNADSKSTKVKNIFLPNEKYIVINAYSTNTLSVVENPLRSPACGPEIRLIVSENIFNLLFRIDEKVLLK